MIGASNTRTNQACGVACLKEKTLLKASRIYAALMIVFAIIGAIRYYSPVPYTDMWPGYIGFYTRVLDGDWFAWVDMFNEHPITLAKLFFWADLHWLGGLNWPLLIVNYGIMAAAALLLWVLLREADEQHAPDTARLTLGTFMVGTVFYWCQWENFTWGFQIALFLGNVLPLCALYWLYLSASRPKSTMHFAIACAFGVLSVGSMGNGILVLPLMAFASLLLRQKPWRILLLSLLSAGTIYGYIIVRHKATAHQLMLHNDHSLATLYNSFLELTAYIFSFLGSPFSYIVGRGTFGKYAAFAAGVAFTICCLLLAVRQWRNAKPLAITLLGYEVFVLLSSVGVSLKRLGQCAPTDPRYTTTAVIGWLVLLVLTAPTVLSLLRKRSAKVVIPLGLVAIAMLASQTTALRSRQKLIFNDQATAVGMAMGVDLRPPGATINPWMGPANEARKRHISIFSIYPYRDVTDQFETIVQLGPLPEAQGLLRTIAPVHSDTRFVSISGWMFDPATGKAPRLIRCIAENGLVVGFALVGNADAEAAKVVGAKGARSGFLGYMLASAQGARITLQGDQPSCQIQAMVAPETPSPPAQ